MRAPQIIIIVLFAICLGMSLANNGKAKIRKESFGMTCVSVAIYTTLLWWGGFFGQIKIMAILDGRVIKPEEYIVLHLQEVCRKACRKKDIVGIAEYKE